MERSIKYIQKKQLVVKSQYSKELLLIDLEEDSGFRCLQCQTTQLTSDPSSNLYSRDSFPTTQDYMIFCTYLNIDNTQIYMKKSSDVQINIQSCYHVFHLNCFLSCQNSGGEGDFVCPLCRQVGNCSIPDAYSVLKTIRSDDFDDERIIEICKDSIVRISKIYLEFPSSKDD